MRKCDVNRSTSYIWPLILVLVIHCLLLGIKMSGNWSKDSITRTLAPITKKAPLIKVKILRHFKFMGRQIVESDDKNDDSHHQLNDAYLSDKTRSLNRQTQTKILDAFHKGGKGENRGGDKNKIELSDLGTFRKNHNPFGAAAKAYSQKLRGEKAGSSLQRGISSSNDHLLDVPLGDFTYLNTVEYKYYGFYYRIRQKLEQFWGRSIQEKAEIMIKQGRSLATDDEHITALTIVLSSTGEIEQIQVKGSSGVRELDDAAIESFNQAGPFPHPPKGLLVNGQVTLEWGFVVKS